MNKQKGKGYNYNYKNNNFTRQQYNQNQEYQPKKFFGKINFSSNEQYKVTRPYEFVEKTEKTEEFVEKRVFFNSKIDLNKEENLKELDTKEDLFLNKFIKATSSNSLGFSSSNENSLQNMPFVNSKKEKKEKKEKEIEINYGDMEVENRNDLDLNKEKNENKNGFKKMIIIQRKDNFEFSKKIVEKKEVDETEKEGNNEEEEDEEEDDEEEKEKEGEKEEKK